MNFAQIDAQVCIKAHDLWVVQIARIDEVFPLLRPIYGAQVCISGFNT